MRRRHQTLWAILPMTLLALPAHAYTGTTSSNGTATSMQIGTYSCRRNIAPTKHSEDTLVTLVNGSTGSLQLCACVVLHDAQQNPIAAGLTKLHPRDTDSINVCAAIESLTGSPAPVAGTLVVGTLANTGNCDFAFTQANMSNQAEGGAYGWTKTVVTKGAKKAPPDPFTAKVVGIDTQALAALPLGLAGLYHLEGDGSPGSGCAFFSAASFASTLFADGTFE